MISMDFLTKRSVTPSLVTGNEFINFQSDEFYRRLTACLDSYIQVDGKTGILSQECQIDVLQLIEDYTGFSNIKIKFLDQGNLYVDVGYFSPGHVFNNPLAEQLMKSSQTTLYRWFVENKGKVFKGGVDYATGRVTGSFRTIPVELGINVNLHNFFPLDKLAKWGVGFGGGLAGGIAHELGHVWSGCMMMMTAIEDNLVARAGLDQYRNAKRPEDRVVVLKDTAALLNLPQGKLDELKALATNDNDEMYLLYYTKMLAQRNSQRALSVGVTEMTSEVVADMYAIRMGCHKGVVAAVSALVDRGYIEVTLDTFIFATFITLNFTYIALLGGIVTSGAIGPSIPLIAAFFVVSGLIGYFTRGYSGTYNADHRRLEDVLRQLIAKLKSKDLPTAEKNELVEMITRLVEAVRKAAPWYDNTVIYRAVGYLFSGSDFKLREVEHFTQALNNHELVALSSQLKSL